MINIAINTSHTHTCIVNAEIFVVTIFRSLNFYGNKIRGLRVATVITVANLSPVQLFMGLFFVVVACLRKLIPSKNSCMYGMCMYVLYWVKVNEKFSVSNLPHTVKRPLRTRNFSYTYLIEFAT